MSTSKRILPYIIIATISIAIIVAAFFLVPMMFNNAPMSDGGSKNPAVDQGDSAFINSIGGVSETYMGAVSTYTYPSMESAASAYVNDELVGNSHAMIVGCETLEEFSADTVDIAIPSEFLDGAESVQKVNVTYSVHNASTYSAMANSTGEVVQQNPQMTVIVYVIKYGPDFRYFTPMPETGKTISKSYYDSVFDSDRYNNCTMETEMSAEVNVDMTYAGQSIKMAMTMSMKQTVKYAGNRIYLYQESNTNTNMYYGGESETDSQNTVIYAYIEQDDYGYWTCYYKTNENDPWQEGYLWNIGFSNIDELKPFHDQYLDYTYFSKTSYGFALEDENAKQYFLQAFDQLSGSMQGIDFGADGIDMVARYYVQEGVLSGTQTEATINAEVSESGQTANMTVVVDSTTTCTEYGSTVVELPGEILDMLK